MAKRGRPCKMTIETVDARPEIKKPIEPIVPVGGEFTEKEAKLITAIAMGHPLPPSELNMTRAEYLAAARNEKFKKAIREYWESSLFLVGGSAVALIGFAMRSKQKKSYGISAAKQKFCEAALAMNGLGKKSQVNKDDNAEDRDSLDDLEVATPATIVKE